MGKQLRLKKTLDRKLRDLDDHLYFLKESLAKLVAGDEAYLKSLAAELRVLVCMSSGTEGLLWRVLTELEVHDIVNVYLTETFTDQYTPVKGLRFAFMPVRHAGFGDSQFATLGHYSLKQIIKEHDAILISGTGYTHEKLIRAVAEQMGTAHEDDGAELYLIELERAIFSNRPALVTVLASDAELVLEVGERVLSHATTKDNFARKARPTIHISDLLDTILTERGIDFEGELTSVPSQGSFIFSLNHPHPDWQTNSNGYDFGLISHGALQIRVAKHYDKTIEIRVKGLGKSIVKTRQTMPNAVQSSMIIGMSWKDGHLVFYLCGIRVDTVHY